MTTEQINSSIRAFDIKFDEELKRNNGNHQATARAMARKYPDLRAAYVASVNAKARSACV